MLNASGESHGDCVEWLQWTSLFDASPLRCPGFANYPTANWLEGNCQSFGKQRDSCPFHALPSFIDDWLDCRRNAGGTGPSRDLDIRVVQMYQHLAQVAPVKPANQVEEAMANAPYCET
jgi:hypothetical protein